MCAAKASSSVRLPEFTRATTFRWMLIVSGAFTICIVLMFAFVYWQTASYLTHSVDGLILAHIASPVPTRMDGREEIELYLREDPRRVKLGGLFDPGGKRLAGNIEELPGGLRPDGTVQTISAVRIDPLGREMQSARAAARRLADGATIVFARNVDEVTQFAEIVGRALAWGLIPALCLSAAAGALLSIRAQKRVDVVDQRVRRIVAGDLRERLPTRGVNDPFDRLALSVNGMLDEIEALVQRIAGAGDDIAHDLRTPLTRVRVTLERARNNAATLGELQTAVDHAIGGLDQSLVIITALLRITEIEHSRRLSGFGEVALADLVREVGELYEPIAEDKRVAFAVAADETVSVRGDRDLLFEAVANLVDNAVKFTPEGGRVALSLARTGDEGIVRVSDTGPGIAVAEHDLVTKRFYRSDKSRRDPGLGLGLSLVAAIAKLHGFRFTISPGPGCVAEIAAPRTPA
jgi:signal transduction histidine kinase